MMLAEAYARLLMGRGWNFIQLECGGVSPELYQGILRLFEDNVSSTSPFGLHAMVLAAASLGHPIGQWFSPSLLAHVCRDQSRKTFPVHFLVVPIENGAFYLSHLRGIVAAQPLVLMVPMRLGIDLFNLFYLGLVTGSLELSQSIGILGGRPGKSYYIVGHQDQHEIFYLDPHVTKGPPPTLLECLINREFHSNDVLALKPESMDPSVTFCFVAKNLADFDDLISNLSKLNIQSPVLSFMP
jgi:cysteine protease ATG4